MERFHQRSVIKFAEEFDIGVDVMIGGGIPDAVLRDHFLHEADDARLLGVDGNQFADRPELFGVRYQILHARGFRRASARGSSASASARCSRLSVSLDILAHAQA